MTLSHPVKDTCASSGFPTSVGLLERVQGSMSKREKKRRERAYRHRTPQRSRTRLTARPAPPASFGIARSRPVPARGPPTCTPPPSLRLREGYYLCRTALDSTRKGGRGGSVTMDKRRISFNVGKGGSKFPAPGFESFCMYLY
ncbi:hypothetical protein LX36DRAFT_659807 [Colletotrichum falcatum]|nr:hypothetical protein LX36DRAFT_659807 [Colletotrichum falcatum]